MSAEPTVETIFGDLPSVQTERLLLRPLSVDDAADVFAYASDPEVSRYTAWESHMTLDDSKAFLATVADLYTTRQVAPWGVEHRADRKLIGTCGFANWNVKHRRAEIAYALSRRCWNRGYTTEAVRAVLDFGYRVMGVNRIEARCDVLNVASARVMEKAGMTFEGILRQHMLVKNAYVDLKLYSILREEWARAAG
jgi:ribosomal-protein-alanine N-acetyltransferase